MNKLLYFFVSVFGFIMFLNCDGRDRVYKPTEEALIENKLLDSFAQNISFYPENYSEIETDTILTNGFEVKIKAYTDMDSYVPFSKTRDSIIYTKNFRNFKFDIVVKKEDKTVYKGSFNKTLANEKLGYRNDFSKDSPFYNFNKLAVLKSIQVDDKPILKDKVLIHIVYAIPYSKREARHTMFIDNNGQTSFVIVEIS